MTDAQTRDAETPPAPADGPQDAQAEAATNQLLDLDGAIGAERNDRYHRQRLIEWWEQDRLQNATVVVVGAGALGNEIIKHLALVGIGNVIVCDFDHVEPSNLSRTVLFRPADENASKCQTAAARAREMNGDVTSAWLHGDVGSDLGLGVIRRADVVIGGVDNIEARIAVDDACWRMQTPYIDGGTHVFEGQVRTFAAPDGPCYRCTLSASQYENMQERMRCNLLLDMDPREAEAKVSTTSVAASIVAAIEVQQALLLLHGFEPLRGKTIVYNGPTNETYTASFEPKDTDWHSHSTLPPPSPVHELPEATHAMTVGQLLEMARPIVGDDAQVSLGRNIVRRLSCGACENVESVLVPLHRLRKHHLTCGCGAAREHELVHFELSRSSDADATLASLGVPALDVLFAYGGRGEAYLELSGDAPPDGRFTGPLTPPAWHMPHEPS